MIRVEVVSTVDLDLRDLVVDLVRDLFVSVTSAVVVSYAVLSGVGLNVRRRLREVLALRVTDLDRLRVRAVVSTDVVVVASIDTGVVILLPELVEGMLFTVVTSLGRVAAA